MRNKKQKSGVFVLGLVIFCLQSFALMANDEVYTIRIPDHCQLAASQAKILNLEDQELGTYQVAVAQKNLSAASLTVTDPFGARKTFSLSNQNPDELLVIESAIVGTRAANPQKIDQIPKLCPRVYVQEKATNAIGENPVDSSPEKERLLYDGRSDFLNARPMLQLLDPDVHEIAAQKTVHAGINHQNALRLKRVRISYDYEDSGILDYQGPHPLKPDEEEILYEGEGGFYANFHYAIVPYDERYLNLGRQETLHLVQGKLSEIDREDLTPPVRVHSFLPGPYLSKTNGYALCEWGDTAYQAKEQELYYHGVVLWDWDIQVAGHHVDRVILFVWEGDEEAWMVEDGMLDPFYITDDNVGVFVVEYENQKPQIFKNSAGDFEIEVETR